MMKMLKLFFVTGLVIVYSISVAQTVKLNVTEETSMTVSGTSTLHDWTSEVKTVNGTVELDEKLVKKEKFKIGDEIAGVNLNIPVKSIISPRGSTMDKKTYNALKSEANPEIIFVLGNNKISAVNGDTFTLNANGSLTMAGKTKTIEFPVEGKFISPGKMSFTGSYKLNMVEYDIEPPSAMYGQIVTGEEVEIKFELIVAK